MSHGLLSELWHWSVELWEFGVLMVSGIHPARRIFQRTQNTLETKEIVGTCLSMYRQTASMLRQNIAQILDLLQPIDPMSINEITTEDGFNLLQLSVMHNDLEFADHLLRDKKCSPNFSKCSLPLHIAIFKDHVEMIDLLLEHNARPHQQSGMCYPEPHIPNYQNHSKFFFVNDSMVCGGCALDAYRMSIDRDDVTLLEKLLEIKKHSRLIDDLLMYSCSKNSVGCVKCLVENHEAELNFQDNQGCTPLVCSLHSLELMRYLIKGGAEYHIRLFYKRNILHHLTDNFATGDDLSDYLSKLSLLLALGSDTVINELDQHNNTPLHYLLYHIKHSQCEQRRSVLISAVELLIKHNASVTIRNQGKKLAWSIILEYDNTEKSTRRDNVDEEGITPISPDNIYKLIQFFCESDIRDVNTPVDENNNPLTLLVNLTLQTGNINYLSSIPLLQSYNCNINIILHYNLTKQTHDLSVLSLTSMLRARALNELKSINNTAGEDSSNNSSESFTSRVLESLLEFGLNPNLTASWCRSQDQVERINLLTAFATLVLISDKSEMLSRVNQWLTVIIQWGANTDMETYSGNHEILTSHSGIFLRHESTLPVRYLLKETTSSLWTNYPVEMLSILSLFQHTMKRSLYEHQLTTSHLYKTSVEYPNIIHTTLHTQISRPYTLQSLSRYALYTHTHRQIKTALQQCGAIPESLRQYVLYML